MTYYVAGNHRAIFSNFSGARLENTVSVSNFNSSFVNSAIVFPAASTASIALPVPLSEIWIHSELYNISTAAAADNPFIVIRDGSLNLFRILPTNSVFVVEYWDGSIWVSTGISITLSISTLYTIDFHVKMNNSVGIIELFVDDLLVGTAFTGDTILTASTTVNGCFFAGISNSTLYNNSISEILIADESTIGAHFNQHTLDAAGDTNDWEGVYSYINQGSRSTPIGTTIVQSDVANEILLANFDALPVHGLSIRGLVLNAEARKDGSSPQNINLTCKSSATLSHGTDKAVSRGYTGVSEIFTVDPSTTVAWTDAGINAAQAGFRSRT